VKRSLVLAIAALAAISSYVVAWDGETYVVSVHDMEIAQDIDTDDVWSWTPDLVVRITRTDPEVRSSIDSSKRRRPCTWPNAERRSEWPSSTGRG